ncbi:hypothetical protein DXG01_006035 [Tephrocybe rancida]|nr:hypothetical protein DXG01_006035 [Tephrocybe rancida]
MPPSSCLKPQSQTAVKKLDAQTRVKLRSSQILTSIPQIVTELVQNSLDAGATNIDIGVDCEEWTCWVRDDGGGINKDGLLLLASGSEEGRYGTHLVVRSHSSILTRNSRKFKNIPVRRVKLFFDFWISWRRYMPVRRRVYLQYIESTALALASAADLGCLEISSRTAHSRDTWSIIAKVDKQSLCLL